MSEFIIQIERLLGAFADPEYRYLLLEPLVSYGLLTGVILLLAGFFAKAPRLQVAAVVVVAAAAMLYFPYKEARLAAKPRLEQVYKLDAPARVSEFAKNTAEWTAASWRFKLLILCAFATFMVGIQRNRIGFGLALATIALGLLAAKNAMWLNYQDALAYHPNLKRHEAPIDRKPGDSVPRPASRAPAAPVAQPVAPAARVPAPPVATPAKPASPASPASAAPPPSPYPDPRTVAPVSAPAAPIPATAAPDRAPQPPFGKKARRVEPLPRF